MNIQPLLRIGARFTISNSPYEVANVGRNGLRVNSVDGGGTRILPLPTVKQMLEEQQIKSISTDLDGDETLRLAGLTDPQYAALNRKLRYVKGVFEKTEHIGSQKKILPIINEIAAELHDDSPPKPSTVASWVKKWTERGYCDAALMPQLKPTRVRLGGDQDLERIVMAAIEKVYMNRQRNSINAVHAEVTCEVIEFNVRHKRALTVPSVETIRKIIRRIDSYQLDAARYGKAYANRRHRAAGQSFHTSEFLELVMADGQVMDVIVVEENSDGTPGRDIGRPYITVLIDIYSRCILSAYISLAPFCAATLLKSLSIACVSNEGHPQGVPLKLIIDNGCDYQSNGFIRACNQLGITLEPCPPRMPNGKAHVERFFRTLNDDLIHKLPGTTFSNPKDRGDYDSQEMARVTLSDLKSHVQTWIEHVYHVRKHRSLMRAPIDVWNKAAANKPIRTIAQATADVMIRSSVQRTVSNGCVQVEGLSWKSDALRTWEIDQRTLGRDPIVEVRTDELDLSHVFVLIPDGNEKGEIIRADSRKPQYTKNLSLYEHKLLKKELEKLEINERLDRMQDAELHRLRLEYFASLGHADDKVAAKRRDRLRDAAAGRVPVDPANKSEPKSQGSATDQEINESSTTAPVDTAQEPTGANVPDNRTRPASKPESKDDRKPRFNHRSIRRTSR